MTGADRYFADRLNDLEWEMAEDAEIDAWVARETASHMERHLASCRYDCPACTKKGLPRYVTDMHGDDWPCDICGGFGRVTWKPASRCRRAWQKVAYWTWWHWFHD